MDKNKLIGIGVIGGGVIVLLIILFVLFGKTFMSSAVKTQQLQVGSNPVSITVTNDRRTPPVQFDFSLDQNGIYWRPISDFSQTDGMTGVAIMQIDVAITLRSGDKLDVDSNNTLKSKTFVLYTKTSSEKSFSNTPASAFTNNENTPFAFKTINGLTLEPGVTNHVSLLYVVPMNSTEFQLHVISQGKEPVDYFFPISLTNK